jgi:hypothetical protein
VHLSPQPRQSGAAAVPGRGFAELSDAMNSISEFFASLFGLLLN